jgi:magnesium chelatase subunit I
LKKVSVAYLDSIDLNELQLVRKDFSENNRFLVSQKMLGIDPSSSLDYQVQLKKLPHLGKVVVKIIDRILKEQQEFVEELSRRDINVYFISIPPKLDGELLASVTELILEGLTWIEPAVLEKKGQSEYGLLDSNE